MQHPAVIMPSRPNGRRNPGRPSRPCRIWPYGWIVRKRLASCRDGQHRKAEVRHARFSLWRAWLTTYEAPVLPPHIHEAMREALTDTPADATVGSSLAGGLAGSAPRPRGTGPSQSADDAGHLRFVIHVAQRYGNRGVPLLDLIQEGNLGRMRAVEKFEPRRGLKLITHASLVDSPGHQPGPQRAVPHDPAAEPRDRAPEQAVRRNEQAVDAMAALRVPGNSASHSAGRLRRWKTDRRPADRPAAASSHDGDALQDFVGGYPGASAR